jgi:hypothetical protein
MEIRIRLRENKALGRQSVPLSISLLRYSYDADAKRARQVVIGSVDFWADKLPADLDGKLTLDERNEWREFVVDRDRQARLALQRFHLKNVVQAIAHASQALEAGETPEDGQLLWSAIDVLAATLEKAGINKEKRERGRPRKESLIGPDYLLLPTDQERKNWLAGAEHYFENVDEDSEMGFQDLPQFAPKRPTRTFPTYPESDLIAHALKLAFVIGDDN